MLKKKIFETSVRLLLSNTARNTYIVFLGNGLSAFFSFVYTVSLARLLTPSDFGLYSALLSLLLLVSDLADIGIGSSLSAFLPPLEEKKELLFSFLKNAFYLQFIIAISILVSMILLSSTISLILFHTSELSLLVQVTAFGIFFAIIANFLQFSLSARQRFVHVSFLMSINGFLRILFLFILIILGMIYLNSVVYMQTLQILFVALIAFFLVKHNFLFFKRIPSDMVKLIRFTYGLGIARGLTAISSRLDVLMLISLTDAALAGSYSIAARVISIYPLLAGSFSAVIAPKLSKEDKLSKDFFKKIVLGTLGIIATIIFLVLISHPFMAILFGEEKGIPAVSTFRLLLVSMIFFVASIPSVSVSIYYLRRPKILTLNSILQLLIVIVGNLIFIPMLGKVGPAVSLILAYGITLITTSFACFYFYKKTR